ncbi:MAG: YybH family protein [Actinomycetota bacterium]
MTHEQVSEWLARYNRAWETYDVAEIGSLFAADAEYRFHPYDEPVRGREAIVAAWLAPEARDEPGTYEGEYRAIAVDGDKAVATGTSTYRRPDGSIDRIYDNCFVIQFDDEGRCSSFTEWYMRRPPASEI